MKFVIDEKKAPSLLKRASDEPEGARETIRRNRPKLAVCLYHKPEHLIDIPLFLKDINPDYRLFVRHHSNLTTDLVLYAV